MEHLLDGDPAANTLSWRWVAGLHTQGKTYLATADNIKKYTEGEIDVPQKLLAEAPNAAPSLSAFMPIVYRFASHTTFNETAAELKMSTSRCALVLTHEDVLPESFLLEEWCPETVVILFPQYPPHHLTSDALRQYDNSVIEDLRQRVATLCSGSSMVFGEDFAQLDAILQEARISSVVVPRIFCGPYSPVATLLARLSAESGIKIVELVRGVEAALTPYATKGFFPFWQKSEPYLRKLLVEECCD
jgi:deoxyribodipyrimidine photo-lyase